MREEDFNWIINNLESLQEAKDEIYQKCAKAKHYDKIKTSRALGEDIGVLEVIDLIKHWRFYENHKHTISILDHDNKNNHIADIKTMVTSKEEIENIIQNIRETVDAWSYDDIIAALPNDCEWIDTDISEECISV